VLFDDPETSDAGILGRNAADSQSPPVGRLWRVRAWRQIGTAVRWGVEAQEERTIIAQPTELGVETVTDLYNVRRRLTGEFGYRDSEASELQLLWRAARIRVLPWLLIPDAALNDAWFVRFEDLATSRIRETINFNRIPFRVRELSRGLPWP
jgi:hypothetical protein